MSLMNLTRYFSHKDLKLAYETHKTVSVIPNSRGTLDIIDTEGKGRKAKYTYPEVGFYSLMVLKCVGEFMASGPVIIRPTVETCREFLNTEVRIPFKDYRQPFPIVGVELPREIMADVKPSLLLMWHLDSSHIISFNEVYVQQTNQRSSHIAIINDKHHTIEDAIIRAHDQCNADTREITNNIRQYVHIALNLCLLAANREIRTTKLDKHAERHRRARDNEHQFLGAMEYQEIVFRHIARPEHIPRPFDYVPGTQGREQAAQRRSGHNKWVWYGPGKKQKKLIWVDAYYTKGGPPEGKDPQTIILE
jgi:hypothetical protein